MSSHNRSLLFDNRTILEDHDFSFIATSPLVVHSHHFNLTFDQVLDDALGAEMGARVRLEAAYESSSQLLNGFISELPPTTQEERFELAANLFTSMGHGSLAYEINSDGTGVVRASHLHYGYVWKQQRGTRQQPADAFAAGYIAASIEAAFGMPLGSVSCVEAKCVARDGGDQCVFKVTPSGGGVDAFGVTRLDIIELVPESFGGLQESLIAEATDELNEFVIKAAMGDKRGLNENFGVYLTHHLGNYYNLCSNRMLSIFAEDRPALLDVAKELLCECGHRDAFYTFGGILASAEWGALLHERSGTSEDVIIGCLAIARALGHGHWALEEYEPDQRLIMRSPSTYESIYRKVAYPDVENGCCFSYQGSALAMMDLAHRVDVGEGSVMSTERYHQLRSDMVWTVNETHCVSAGHDMCRIVVERT